MNNNGHQHHEHGHVHSGDSGHAESYLQVEEREGLKITLMEHEEALVASLSLEVFGEAGQVAGLISESLGLLVSKLEAAGAMIGHLKGALSGLTPLATFDSVGKSVNTSTHQPSAYRLELAVIVFNIDQGLLFKLVQDTAGQLMMAT